MASLNNAALDHELTEQFSVLSPTQKRALLDFASFLASQRSSKRRLRSGQRPSRTQIINQQTAACPLDAIVNLAPDCKDTDLSINHDKYLYGDEAQ